MSTTITDGNGQQLFDSDQVAKLVGCHPRHVPRMESEGVLPRGLKIGKLKRWSRKTINDWIDQGCPKQEGGDQ